MNGAFLDDFGQDHVAPLLVTLPLQPLVLNLACASTCNIHAVQS